MKIIIACIVAAIIAFGISFGLGYIVIPFLHKIKFGQTILDIGPKWHKNKQGTPTMGGILFIVGTVVAFGVVLVIDKLLGGNIIEMNDIVADSMRVKIYGGLIMALGFAFIGFLDDYIKVVKKRNKGLSIIQKTVLQIVLMVVVPLFSCSVIKLIKRKNNCSRRISENCNNGEHEKINRSHTA
ncbi:MAG: hypothetical protein J6A43_04030 [Clostridia bacterium]|nr:hypothetical protein [Clostridia bacterium]